MALITGAMPAMCAHLYISPQLIPTRPNCECLLLVMETEDCVKTSLTGSSTDLNLELIKLMRGIFNCFSSSLFTQGGISSDLYRMLPCDISNVFLELI